MIQKESEYLIFSKYGNICKKGMIILTGIMYMRCLESKSAKFMSIFDNLKMILLLRKSKVYLKYNKIVCENRKFFRKN